MQRRVLKDRFRLDSAMLGRKVLELKASDGRFKGLGGLKGYCTAFTTHPGPGI